MKFPPLVTGTLIKRYKRFLSDVRLDNGDIVTAHCANPGSMMGLKQPGARVWLSTNNDPKRKLKYSWELLEVDLGCGPHLVGINTNHPNSIVADAITQGRIAELDGYGSLRREVKYGKNSRIDILLQDETKPDCYVEIKNVHLMRQAGYAEFPDSVTTRGKKHLNELSAYVEKGYRCVMFYLIQRTDAETFGLARDIDPDYARSFDKAIKTGVEAYAYSCTISRTGIDINAPVLIADIKGYQF
jgi:sugar fermentation stimulation protein A